MGIHYSCTGYFSCYPPSLLAGLRIRRSIGMAIGNCQRVSFWNLEMSQARFEICLFCILNYSNSAYPSTEISLLSTGLTSNRSSINRHQSISLIPCPKHPAPHLSPTTSWNDSAISNATSNYYKNSVSLTITIMKM